MGYDNWLCSADPAEIASRTPCIHGCGLSEFDCRETCVPPDARCKLCSAELEPDAPECDHCGVTDPLEVDRG